MGVLFFETRALGLASVPCVIVGLVLGARDGCNELVGLHTIFSHCAGGGAYRIVSPCVSPCTGKKFFLIRWHVGGDSALSFAGHSGVEVVVVTGLNRGAPRVVSTAMSFVTSDRTFHRCLGGLPPSGAVPPTLASRRMPLCVQELRCCHLLCQPGRARSC